MVCAGIGVATGLVVSYPQVKDYVTITKNFKELNFTHKKNVLAAMKQNNPDFSAKKLLTNMKNVLSLLLLFFVQLEKKWHFCVTIQQLIRYIYRQSNLGKYFLS